MIPTHHKSDLCYESSKVLSHTNPKSDPGDSDSTASDILSDDSFLISVFEEELNLMGDSLIGDSDSTASDILSDDSFRISVFEEELNLMGDYGDSDSTASDCLSNDSVVYSVFEEELDLMGISATSGYLSDDTLMRDSAAYDCLSEEICFAGSAGYYSSSDAIVMERRMPRRAGRHRKYSKAKKRAFYGFV